MLPPFCVNQILYSQQQTMLLDVANMVNINIVWPCLEWCFSTEQQELMLNTCHVYRSFHDLSSKRHKELMERKIAAKHQPVMKMTISL